jgi:kumamolisin
MKRSLFLLMIVLAIVAVSISSFAQDQASTTKGTIVAPASTKGLAGLKVHTPLYIFAPEGNIKPDNSPPASAETPGSVACIYGVTPPTNGCPKSGSPVATGGARAIAVVDYGHNSTLQADFNTFNTQYGLPAQTLQFICDCSSCPSSDGTGWDVEVALDTEYAHAMAPNAQIIVSQFCSDPFEGGDSAAEWLGGQAVASYGGGEESNSFDYDGEFSGETEYDQYMTVQGVVYTAATGDGGCQTNWPAASPNAIAAGGTHIIRDSNGNFTGNESVWSGSGGGISQYEALPSYQLIIGNIAGAHKGTPDVAAIADPNTGVAVYSTTGCGGWCQVGGTSVATPVIAGIVNAAGQFRQQTMSELNTVYGWYRNPGLYRKYIYDVTMGSNGGTCGAAKVGWDKDSGLGTPRNLAGF